MNQKMMKTALTAASALAAVKAARAISGVEVDDVLGWAGVERQRGRFWQTLGLIGAGACAGAVTALLFAPGSGRQTRKRLAEEMERLGEQAREQIREATERAIEEARRVSAEMAPPSETKAPETPAPHGMTGSAN